MKFVITGHKSGLGQALCLRLQYYQNFDQNQVVGYDIIDGHDIGKLSTVAKILQLSRSADVFINNAYDVFGQTMLLKYILKIWRYDPNKLIIHIGSFLVDKPESFYINFNSKEKKYIEEKRKQKNMIEIHRQIDSQLKIIEINPALLDTNFIHSLDGILPKDKLLQNTTQTADLIIKLIDYLQFGIYTKTITFDNLNLS